MTTWFTSDLHIGHKLVSGLRGFWRLDQDGVRVPDTEAHDAAIADNWDATVGPSDTVYVLGDLSINSGTQVDDWFVVRPGKFHLISGNHDKTQTAIFKSTKSAAVFERWNLIFKSILDEDTIEIAGRKVTLSHFPYRSFGDGEGHNREPGFQPRFMNIRPWESDTSILLHGHTHGPEVAHGRQYHVGLDAHELQLVHEDTIADWVRSLD